MKVDRAACPWLIRNFIDSILKRHRLTDPALTLLAEIVRAAVGLTAAGAGIKFDL